MANRKTTLTKRYSIKADPAVMLAFDLECKKAGTNRSARINELMRRDSSPISVSAAELQADEADREQWAGEQ